MVLIDVFETKNRNYQLNTDTGLYYKKDQPDSIPKIFLGSIDENAVLIYQGMSVKFNSIPDNVNNRANVFLDNILNNTLKGFTPRFIEGYFHFGIACQLDDIRLLMENNITFSNDLISRLK